MKTIGLIGGMSWESSLSYYKLINQKVKLQLGGNHSAQCLMYSVDFDEIAYLQHLGDWAKLSRIMVTAAQNLEKGGADFIILCTNTMHKLATDIISNTHIPFLHIADATAASLKEKGIKKAALLGTRYTMEGDFLKGKISSEHGIDIIIPDDDQRRDIHRIIYDELVNGILKEESRQIYLETISSLAASGAEGIILGCTEIGLLIRQEDTDQLLFDTTEIHASAAVKMALS